MPCKPGVADSISDFKPWPRLHMTLAVGGTLNTNTATTFSIDTIDEVLMQKLEDQDLVVKEADYNNHCR